MSNLGGSGPLPGLCNVDASVEADGSADASVEADGSADPEIDTSSD
jgi:hypothetical protein